MRRSVTFVVAVMALAAALAVPSIAQAPPVELKVNAQVIPNKAGTPKNPQGVKIKASVEFMYPAGYDREPVDKGYVLFPKGSQYNGDDYPKCDPRRLARKGPKTGCPKGSYMGEIKAEAWADNVVTYPQIFVFNGGAKLALAHVTLYNPALVKEVVKVHVKKLRHPKWQYKASADIPPNLEIVAGIPIAPKKLWGTIGRGTWLATTFCPKSRRWEYEGKGFFTDGTSVTHRDSVPCRPSGG
jgi:hypothetical protein